MLRCARIHSRDLVRERVAWRPQVVSKDKMFMVMDFMEHDLKGLMNAMTQPFTASEARGGFRRRPALGAVEQRWLCGAGTGNARPAEALRLLCQSVSEAFSEQVA